MRWKMRSRRMPALLMTPSILPKVSTAVLTMRSAPAGAVMLSAVGPALPPAARIAPAVGIGPGLPPCRLDLVAHLLRRRGAARSRAVDRAAQVVDHDAGA